MPIDLLEHMASTPNNDRMGTHALYRTNVPHVAPFEYLHVVFKSASPEMLDQAPQWIGSPVPVGLRQFYEEQNGANIFSSAIAVHGLVVPGTLLDRSSYFTHLPFNVVDLMRSQRRAGLFPFATYCARGEVVSIVIDSGAIQVADIANTKVIRRWENLDSWLTAELKRLHGLFDLQGHCQVDFSLTGPQFALAMIAAPPTMPGRFAVRWLRKRLTARQTLAQ